MAARYLSELREDSCVDSVLDILQSETATHKDTISKIEAPWNSLPTFIGHATGQDSQEVLELVAKALDDPAT